MNPSDLLSIPLESLALSSSSSFSSSSCSSLFSTELQTSDSSQSDSSESSPHSPRKDVETTNCIAPQTSRSPLFLDLDTTPKLQSYVRERTDWLGAKADIGYDSELEDYTNTSLGNRQRLTTRKRRTSQGLGLTVQSPMGKTTQGWPCYPTAQSSSPSTSAAVTCPPKPRILPISSPNLPSPIIPLPSSMSNFKCTPSEAPERPFLGPRILCHGDISPMEELPPAMSLYLLDEEHASVGKALPTNPKMGRTPPLFSTETFLASPTGSSSGRISLEMDCPVTPPVDHLQATDILTAPVRSSSVPSVKKAPSGIGLGLPIAVDHRAHLRRKPLFMRTPSPPCLERSSHQWLRGIVSGTRHLFDTYHHPQKRLLAIPELVSLNCSPLKAKASSISYLPRIVEDLPKHFTSRRLSTRTSSFCPRSVVATREPSRHTRSPPLLDSSKKPRLWPTRRSELPPSPQNSQMSPGVHINPDVPHELNLARQWNDTLF